MTLTTQDYEQYPPCPERLVPLVLETLAVTPVSDMHKTVFESGHTQTRPLNTPYLYRKSFRLTASEHEELMTFAKRTLNYPFHCKNPSDETVVHLLAWHELPHQEQYSCSTTGAEFYQMLLKLRKIG